MLCTCTRSCTRTYDAKIVRSRDAQCILNHLKTTVLIDNFAYDEIKNVLIISPFITTKINC